MEYLPRPILDESFEPSKADLDFAEAFRLLSDLLEQMPRSGLQQLRLSTCRNAFMTVNSLYVSVRAIVGKASHFSRLARLAHAIRNHEMSVATNVIDEISSVLGEIKNKLASWEQRESLDMEREAAIDSLKRRSDRDRIRGHLNNVKPDLHEDGQHVDLQYVMISVVEPQSMVESLNYFRRVFGQLVAIREAARMLTKIDLSDVEPSLFESDRDEEQKLAWNAFFDVLAENAESLRIDYDKDSQSVSMQDANRVAATIGRELPQRAEIELATSRLADRIDEHQASLHAELRKNFRPNVARRQLPSLFCIDLTDQLPSDPSNAPPVKVLPVRFGVARPDKIRVATLKFGIPKSAYSTNGLVRYLDSRTTEITDILLSCVSNAASAEADVLFLPEYSIPRGAMSQIEELARESNIAVIGGLEAKTSADNSLLLNEAWVYLPEASAAHSMTQAKRTPSPYEPRVDGDGTFSLFLGTRLGNFSVIMCSDMRELDFYAALATSEEPVDCIFVCCLNPHPELFETLAIADSQRLYSFVAIANNYWSSDDEDSASNLGTVICRPMRQADQQVMRNGHEEITLGIPPVGGSSSALSVFDVQLSELVRTSARTSPGYVPVPRSRQSS